MFRDIIRPTTHVEQSVVHLCSAASAGAFIYILNLSRRFTGIFYRLCVWLLAVGLCVCCLVTPNIVIWVQL